VITGVNEKLRKLFISKFILKRLMISLLLIPLFVYSGLLIFAYLFADKLIFQPQPASYRDDEKIIKLTTSNGEKISARFYPNPNATHIILFSHGNAEDLNTSDLMVKEFQKNGFAILVYDYRGYGSSEGNPTEENVYQDIDAAYEYLTNELKISPEKIIAHGRSLGGAVAIDLASRKKVGGLIVESSFVSAFRVLTGFSVTPFDKFRNLAKIKNISCPVLFFHGRNDRIIPFWHGEKLFAEANEPKFSYWIDEAGHNNIYQIGGKSYLQRIRDFADNLPK
jgi:abhydrolase domain-containing protein 17